MTSTRAYRLARAILAALVSLGAVAVLALVFGAMVGVHWVLHWVGGP